MEKALNPLIHHLQAALLHIEPNAVFSLFQRNSRFGSALALQTRSDVCVQEDAITPGVVLMTLVSSSIAASSLHCYVADAQMTPSGETLRRLISRAMLPGSTVETVGAGGAAFVDRGFFFKQKTAYEITV